VPPSQYDDLLKRAVDGYLEIAHKTPQELRDWAGALSHLPPTIPFTGGSVIVTVDALMAARELGRLWYDNNPSVHRQLSKLAAEERAVEAFAQLLEEWPRVKNKKELLRKRFQKILQRIVKDNVLGEYFYFPIRGFEQTEVRSIKVGPVVFERPMEWVDRVERRSKAKSDWKRLVIEQLSNHKTMSRPPIEELRSSLEARVKQSAIDVVEFIGSADFIASVRVPKRDRSLSEKCAESAVTIALDSLAIGFRNRVLARGLRGPGDNLSISQLRSMSQFQGDSIQQTVSLDVPRLGGPAGFQKSFLRRMAPVRTAAGSALRAYIEVEPKGSNPDLKRRWIEAMYWFGQSRREGNDFIALVKLGITLDILANGKKYKGILQLCRDISGWTDATPILPSKNLSAIVKGIYDLGRSQLAHGGRFGLLHELPVDLKHADDFTEQIVMMYIIYLTQYTGPDEYEHFLTALPSLRATRVARRVAGS
jgi:hypothetical protein